MGYRYLDGMKTSVWPRLSSQENGGRSVENEADEEQPAVVPSFHSEAAPMAAVSGFTFMQPFHERRIQSSACLKRQELIARRSTRQREQIEWSDAEKSAFEAEWYHNQLEWIESIHQICGEPIDWERLAALASPFRRGEIGPHERQAEADFADYKPTRMQKLLKQDAAVKQELQDQIVLAKEKDQQEYTEWRRLTDFARDILEGNRTAYLRVLEEIAPLEDLLALGSGLEYNVLNSAAVEVELDVNSGEIIPHESKILNETGELSRSRLSKEDYHELERKYVCGSVIRIGHELFALLPLETVLIHARDTKVNLETGQEEYVTVLSIRFERSAVPEMDLAQEACPQLLAHFEHHIRYDASTGFDPVEKLSRP
ncbi:hypothetical protein GRF59_17445 [Paenibacillus sp. HJL G12]|uniref:Uncharacterized protein n=1 Tax=Paenibacillus dendrobii TaxID=2691084 RepID=A0A7X3LIM8_9BACL|nr:hypothetical protein [Paenibacillus dendrobii]MWV45410.1 hypothetical protein [Paenibacillus dendrobii]